VTRLAIETLVRAEEGLVSPEIFHDREIFDLEARRLFMRTWLFVGHESMIPKRGDFVATHMGLNPVLLVRQRDGGVKVVLNSCRHRGMKVCRADAGNSKAFTCTFHGWSYGLDGALVNVPLEKDAYGGVLDRSRFGLVEVPRVETYKGLVFANFEPDAPSLVEYLGDMAWYLDSLLDRREGGTEVLGGVHKIQHVGNWKMGAEQFAGDNYHAFLTHVSAMMSVAEDSGSVAFSSLLPGYQFTSPAGHGVVGWRAGGMDAAPELPSNDFRIVRDYYRRTEQEVADRIGTERVHGPSLGAANVFPNFSYLQRVFNQSSIGVWHPREPGLFEYWRYCIVDKAAPPEVKSAMLRNMHVWPLGVADADDGENWSEITHNLDAPAVRDQLLNYQMGMGTAVHDHATFPGTITEKYVAEESQRNFYRRWQEFMTSDAYPAVSDPIKYADTTVGGGR
jgi:3-phenylpropionate/trans-cinnamate dioxygenase subunit alpha